jgi:hypothetical protein
MSAKSPLRISTEELDRLFDEGEVDILQFCDLTKTRRPGLEPGADKLPSATTWPVDFVTDEEDRARFAPRSSGVAA